MASRLHRKCYFRILPLTGEIIRKLKNIHPGEILLEEFIKPLEISQNKLARDIAVPPRRINEIVLGKRSITADTALRLAKALGTSEGFWLGLQQDYDLEEKRRKIGKELAQIKCLIPKNIAPLKPLPKQR
jgi:addiction module HigA family antidote